MTDRRLSPDSSLTESPRTEPSRTDAPAGDARAAVSYPLETVPGDGEAVEIAPGVLWMRMPLGGQLPFINVWALRDGDGWALIDTGIHTDATSKAWRAVIAGPLGGRPITRLFATHLHPDHIGLAGWITRKFGCRLWMSRLEYLQCRMLADDTGREPPPEALAFYRRAGWDEESVEDYKARFGKFGKMIYQMPDSYRRVRESEQIQIGEHLWRVVVGSGHSPEHVCLFCPELKLFISGDQVLPRISSNVSVHAIEPDADPLSEWLSSLARIRLATPNDVLVLPAHNEPFLGLHARLDHLIQGHERGLERLRGSLAEPRRVVDAFGALFARKIGRDLLGMATGEALAHLNCLIARGQAVVETDASGVAWYRAAGGGAA